MAKGLSYGERTKMQYEEIITAFKTQDEQAYALKSFFLECAKRNDTQKMKSLFYYLTQYTKFPLEKINLCGDNNVSVYKIIVQAEFAGPSRDFLLEFYHNCHNIKGLEEKSDKYYYATHPEANLGLLASVAIDEDSFI